jgi:hypothetical protein
VQVAMDARRVERLGVRRLDVDVDELVLLVAEVIAWVIVLINRSWNVGMADKPTPPRQPQPIRPSPMVGETPDNGGSGSNQR